MNSNNTIESNIKSAASKESLKIAGRLAKKIREDSMASVKLTRLDSLTILAPEIEPETIRLALDELASSKKYEDIRSQTDETGRLYYFSNAAITEKLATRLIWAEEYKGKAAARIRANAKDNQQPTSVSSLSVLVKYLKADEIKASLEEMTGEKDYADIKPLVTAAGTVYMFSEEYLPEDKTKKLAAIDEFQSKVVGKVRGDSKYTSRLTEVSSLFTLTTELSQEEIQTAITNIAKQPRWEDIKTLTGKSGAAYMCCADTMSETYARILLRVEAKDPSYTIAETVREESRVYPRPTHTEQFKYGVFNIDREQLENYVAQTLAQYPDIKQYIASTGAVYLYSDLYLSAEQVELKAEIQEHPRK